MRACLQALSTLKSSSRRLLGSIVLLWALAPPPLQAREVEAACASGSAVEEWLHRVAAASQQHSYRGILTHQYNDDVEVLRMTAGQVEGRPYERLEHLDGEPREIIRHGERVVHLPGEEDAVPLSRLPATSEVSREIPGEHYELCPESTRRIAGRSAVVWSLLPRDGLRHGYRLGLDRDTDLLLSWEWLDASQRTLERLRFSVIDIDISLASAWLVLPAEEGDPLAIEPLPRPESPAWKPSWLPSGFVPVRAAVEGGRMLQTYADGLAALTVFVEPVADQGWSMGRDGQARRGATVAYLHHVLLNGEPYRVTVLGEVPPATARQVAQSVVWQRSRL